MNNPEATTQALAILRNGDNFQWYIIPPLMVVFYIYFDEYSRKNYKCIAAGLSLYMVHWFYEIVNALIQHCSGHSALDSSHRNGVFAFGRRGRGTQHHVCRRGNRLANCSIPIRRRKYSASTTDCSLLLNAAAFSPSLRYFWPRRPRLSGLSLVGLADGVYHGLYSLLRGLHVFLPTGGQNAENCDWCAVWRQCPDADCFCGNS